MGSQNVPRHERERASQVQGRRLTLEAAGRRVRSVARCALMRCLRLRSASLWFLLGPLRVVAVTGAEHSPSKAAASDSSLWKGTIPVRQVLDLGFKAQRGGKRIGSTQYVRSLDRRRIPGR